MKLGGRHFLLVGLFFTSLFSCSSFVYEKKIIEDYYLIGVDMENYLSIRRKLSNGDYIGRIPPNVLEYAVVDSLIIAKSINGKVVEYFILNMHKDSEYAKEEDFLIGPLNEQEYSRMWSSRLTPELISVQ